MNNAPLWKEQEEGEDLEQFDADEAVSEAGARYLRLYFVLHSLDKDDTEAFGGMVKAARRAAEVGEWGASLALSDRIKEDAEGKGEREEGYATRQAQSIRDAVK